MREITVFASGRGTNFANIVHSGIPVSHLITDNPDAGAIEFAQEFGTYWTLVPFYTPREEWGEELIHYTGQPDLIVLAGFMRILPRNFITEYQGRIINVHPSLLPAFKGSTDAITDAYEAGCFTFGATVHKVIERVDAGQILAQYAVNVDNQTSLEEIRELVHGIEYRILPETIKNILGL